ncbi:hypothetical protein J437_LFUL002914 [Ladona fulva]|uniref:Uncharacterized protein n=1 Tax=Ladona fulva TaxID=123851 RepID=A0A8K0KN88_LADFU|nr:hypothetical protein J437_LFUL002914 [Ladona fulva]
MDDLTRMMIELLGLQHQQNVEQHQQMEKLIAQLAPATGQDDDPGKTFTADPVANATNIPPTFPFFFILGEFPREDTSYLEENRSDAGHLMNNMIQATEGGQSDSRRRSLRMMLWMDPQLVGRCDGVVPRSHQPWHVFSPIKGMECSKGRGISWKYLSFV